MTTRQTLISVIVPIMNAGPYLEQCLDSIESQTHHNLEIILINDGSTDNSLAIMQEHAKRDERITIVDKKNQGYGATCNRGIDESHGEYIAIVEPDDWIEPDMYKDMLSYADAFKVPIDIVKTPYWRIWMPDTPQQRKLNCSYKGRINPATQPFAVTEVAHLLRHHPSIWSAIYRKDFLMNRNIRFKEIPGAGWADNPFLVETLCQTNRIAYLDTPYYCYREETPEKSKAFAHKNTLLPIDRWNDMMDVLNRLDVTDERILRAHNSRGFTYLSGIIGEVNLSHEGVYEAAQGMFERMNPDLVFGDNEIPPGYKRLFAELRGIPCPKINKLAYIRGLIRQGLYSLKNTGFSHTSFVVTTYLKKELTQTGGDSDPFS